MGVDEQFMIEVGLNEMPPAEKEAFMAHAQEELEIRVGRGIGAYLTDAQMSEFEAIEDVDEAAKWLNANVPNYIEVVDQIHQNFKQEILQERAKILGQA